MDLIEQHTEAKQDSGRKHAKPDRRRTRSRRMTWDPSGAGVLSVVEARVHQPLRQKVRAPRVVVVIVEMVPVRMVVRQKMP